MLINPPRNVLNKNMLYRKKKKDSISPTPVEIGPESICNTPCISLVMIQEEKSQMIEKEKEKIADRNPNVLFCCSVTASQVTHMFDRPYHVDEII